MTLEVYLAGTKVTLTEAQLLGEGGEARVYRHGAQALKVFHRPTDAAGRRALDEKVTKLQAFPAGLPAAVIGPSGLLTSKKGEVLGYAMPLVSGAHDLGRLANRKWREQLVSTTRVAALFRALHGTLEGLHQAQVVAGDLNDGNVVFTLGDDAPRLIDTDSFQFGGFTCAVGHERFLDPRLYGVDLAAAPAFSPGTDWYAFAVLLFQSLLSVHPYGGTHQRLTTALRRAEARHSVYRPDVKLPRLATPVSVLPDDLNHHLRAVFEHDERATFPERLLDLRFQRCACGLEHARALCPDCHALGPLVARQALRSHGRCTARTAFETSGRVLAARNQGGLRYVYEEAGVCRREDGGLVLPHPAAPGTRFGLSGASTWVALPDGALTRVTHGQVVERASTGLRGLEPVLASWSGGAYRQEGGWLLEQTSGARVGQVLEGQTWLWAGERLSLGFYRVGGLTVAFLLRAGQAGLKQLPQVGWQGRLVDAEAVFDARHALLTVVSERAGQEVVQRWLFDEAGALLGHSSGGPRGGAALLAGRVVLGTDQGLVLLKGDGGVLLPATQFPDSQPFVCAGDELLAGSDGSITVVGARDIIQLSLSQ